MGRACRGAADGLTGRPIGWLVEMMRMREAVEWSSAVLCASKAGTGRGMPALLEGRVKGQAALACMQAHAAGLAVCIKNHMWR